MNKQEFINEVMKTAAALGDYVTPSKRGEHCAAFLGFTRMPGTARHAAIVWQKYGCMDNLVILYTAEEVNQRLQAAGVDSFRARPTKSGRFCRLIATR